MFTQRPTGRLSVLAWAGDVTADAVLFGAVGDWKYDTLDRPLRPAILWNDGRSEAECLELERRVPAARLITGNLAMPGFTAPEIHKKMSLRASVTSELVLDGVRVPASSTRTTQVVGRGTPDPKALYAKDTREFYELKYDRPAAKVKLLVVPSLTMQPIDQLPVDALNSANWVNSIGANQRLHADWGNNPNAGGVNETR